MSCDSIETVNGLELLQNEGQNYFYSWMMKLTGGNFWSASVTSRLNVVNFPGYTMSSPIRTEENRNKIKSEIWIEHSVSFSEFDVWGLWWSATQPRPLWRKHAGVSDDETPEAQALQAGEAPAILHPASALPQLRIRLYQWCFMIAPYRTLAVMECDGGTKCGRGLGNWYFLFERWADEQRGRGVLFDLEPRFYVTFWSDFNLFTKTLVSRNFSSSPFSIWIIDG